MKDILYDFARLDGVKYIIMYEKFLNLLSYQNVSDVPITAF